VTHLTFDLTSGVGILALCFCENAHEQVLEFLVCAGWVALGSAEYAAVGVVVRGVNDY
jgi:hypothetical protein